MYDCPVALFDTLKASLRLREAGFDEEKAGAIVAAFAEDMGGRLATRDDIDRLEEKIETSDERLEQRMTIRMGVVATTATGVLLAAIGIATGVLAAL